MCGTQLEDAHVNCCALSEVQTIVKDGLVNEQLLGGMLGMLTSQSHELETDVLLQSESKAVQI